MMLKTVLVICAVCLAAHAGDPLKVVREKGFYKEGAASKNTVFTEWLKKPIIGSESIWQSKAVKRSAAFSTLRDQGFKDKEARMREEMEAEQAGSAQ